MRMREERLTTYHAPSARRARCSKDHSKYHHRDQDMQDLIHDIFDRQAAMHAGSIALSCGRTHLTYGQLKSRSDRLAAHLKREGVGVGSLVGICVDRSPELIIGLLGILKAGAAYVPL